MKGKLYYEYNHGKCRCSSKFEFVTNYLKKYNIDLEAIAQGPEEWDIKPYPELPEADAGDDDDDPWGDW